MLSDDEAELKYHLQAIADEAGCSRDQFQVAARTAYECASWWRDTDSVEEGRQRLLAKLEKLTGVPAA